MFQFTFNFIRTKESTELNLEAKVGSDTQDDSSLKGKVGLITDYLLLIVNFTLIVVTPIIDLAMPLIDIVAKVGEIIS